MNPYHHALSSAARFGGQPDDYLPLHQWLDESKAYFADFRHRALRHHAEGIFLLERLFGATITNSDGRAIPVRFIGEQHVKEDLGRIPTAQDWLGHLAPAPWMMKRGKLLYLNEARANENSKRERCECQQDGHFCSGIPGILAHLEGGKLQPSSAVERCDLCQRYPSDEAALQRLRELGIA